MEILLCNIHITIYCISCNHHNFAARLFIPLCKRDGSAYTNCCAAYSQQFLMCVLSRLRTFAARQMQAIWLRSQESGRNNLFFAVETFLKNFFLCDQDMSDKQYFSLWCCSGVIVSNYILNKNVFKPTQISNLTWCALCDKRDKVWTQSTTNALLLIVQHNSNAIHVNWIWMTKLNRKMFHQYKD